MEPLRAAAIGRTGRGDWGHAIDGLWVGLPGVELAAIADDADEGLAKAVERNKLAATRGWLADPPPHTPEPLPAHHIGKWWRMHGQVPPSER